MKKKERKNISNTSHCVHSLMYLSKYVLKYLMNFGLWNPYILFLFGIVYNCVAFTEYMKNQITNETFWLAN